MTDIISVVFIDILRKFYVWLFRSSVIDVGWQTNSFYKKQKWT